MTQYEEQREERLKKRRKRADLQGPVDIIKRPNICAIGVTKRRGKNGAAKNI